MIHANSYTSFQGLNRASRQHIILRMYETWGELTDRRVAEILGFKDMNQVRPRITELLNSCDLVWLGDTTDKTTYRPVRVCRRTTAREKKELLEAKKEREKQPVLFRNVFKI